jgi:membrane protein DedA with SNARE-associated domain
MPRYDFKSNKFLKYSGLAVQIFATLAIAAWFGKWLDRKLEMDKPIFTAVTSIVMLVLLMIWINYDIKKQDE